MSSTSPSPSSDQTIDAVASRRPDQPDEQDRDPYTHAAIWTTPALLKWESVKVALRLLTGLCSFGICVAILSYEHQKAYFPTDGTIAWPAALPAMAATLWDLAESLVRFARFGNTLPPRALVACDSAATLGSVAGSAILAWQLAESDTLETRFPGKHIAHVTVIGLMACTSILARGTLLFRGWEDRTREVKCRRPRTAYAPATGTVVCLLSPRRQRRHVAEGLELQLLDMAGEDCDGNSKLPDAGARHRQQSSRQGYSAETRRPGTSTPPPLDHVPDVLELERQRRGELQPQMIPSADKSLKCAVDRTGRMLAAPPSSM